MLQRQNFLQVIFWSKSSGEEAIMAWKAKKLNFSKLLHAKFSRYLSRIVAVFGQPWISSIVGQFRIRIKLEYISITNWSKYCLRVCVTYAYSAVQNGIVGIWRSFFVIKLLFKSLPKKDPEKLVPQDLNLPSINDPLSLKIRVMA